MVENCTLRSLFGISFRNKCDIFEKIYNCYRFMSNFINECLGFKLNINKWKYDYVKGRKLHRAQAFGKGALQSS